MGLTRRTVLGIKTETTQGTAVALSDTDFMLVSDLKVKPVAEGLMRDYYRSSLSPLAEIKGKRFFDVSFKTAVRNGGAAGTAYAPLSACLQACGLAETISAGVSVSYAPTSVAASANFFGPGKSATIKFYFEGNTGGTEWISAGCLGNCKISLEAGKFGVYEFTFKGLYAEPTDAAFPSQTYVSTLEPIVQNSSLTVHTLAAIASKFEIDFGNEVTERIDTRSAYGLMGYYISNRRLTGSFDPEFQNIATHNFLNKFMSMTEASASIVVGATAGNITTITMPKVQYNGAEPDDRGGRRILTVPFLGNGSSGDDEIGIVLT